MTVTTRTAPRNARFNRPSPEHLAAIDNLVTRARAFERSGSHVAGPSMQVAAGQADPTPDVPPNTPPDTGARLDAQDAQLQDHEQRIAALEERSPPPQGLNDRADQTPAEARASRNLPTMVDSRAIYARMNTRPAGLKAAAPAPQPPEQIQPGQVLDGRAINARFNALAALRSGRTA